MSEDTEFSMLHALLIERYNLEELYTLCTQLNVPYQDLGVTGRQSVARELILWLKRRKRLDDLTAILSSEPSLQASSSTTQRSDRIDVAIVTAMDDELRPVLKLIGGKDRWQSLTIDQFLHYQARFEVQEGSLNVVACSLWKYGAQPTVAQILRLKQLKPRLIVMTGICAGWEAKEVHFGDVIVADRAFQLGEGKQTDKEFQPDLRTPAPPPWLLQWLGDFAHDQEWSAHIQAGRPRSLRYQAEWLLCQVAQRGASFPETEADWEQVRENGIDFPRAWQRLVDGGLLDDAGALTEAAQANLNALRRKNYGKLLPLPDPAQPRVHYGAFASTEAVMAVTEPFAEAARHTRKVRAIELEVAALFTAATEIGVPAFAVKGVSDYGTPEKDDMFRDYAAEAAACWMHGFLRSYGKHLLGL